MLSHSVLIIAASIAIYFLGEWFADASSRVGDHFGLPRGVKGATLDAVNSSLPELLVALFAVIFFGRFDVGVATVAGSAAFNLIVIPALCALVAPAALRIGGHVVDRDGVFYFFSLVLFIVAVWHSQEWGVFIAMVFLAVYALYIRRFVKDARAYHDRAPKKSTKMVRDAAILVATMIGMAAASYLLVEQAILLAEALNVHPVIIAFTVIAAATSVPDAVVSVANAKKGSGDDAVSNALGSNTFNILVGLPIPVLAYVLLQGERVPIFFDYIEILFGLLAATVIVLYLISNNKELGKKQGVILLLLYLLFMLYVAVRALTA